MVSEEVHAVDARTKFFQPRTTISNIYKNCRRCSNINANLHDKVDMKMVLKALEQLHNVVTSLQINIMK